MAIDTRNDRVPGGQNVDFLGAANMRVFVATGLAAAGGIVVAGTVVGQRIIGAFRLPTAAAGFGAENVTQQAPADFEATVSIAGQIQQLTAVDLSARRIVFLVAPPLV